MKKIFVNLKRFEVSRERGGICPEDSPIKWIKSIVKETIALGLGRMENVFVTYFVPEALLSDAIKTLEEFHESERGMFAIGCQSVFREDITPGGNFGAFTSNRPANAMAVLGCRWTLIAHSEERKDKLQIMMAYDPAIQTESEANSRACLATNRMFNEQIKSAIRQNLRIVYCVGETVEEKGDGEFSQYAPRVRQVIKTQLEYGICDLGKDAEDIVIAYEPIWAIGPGKTPPDSDYISFVSSYIKDVTKEITGKSLDVVYGGGLKEENAKSIARVSSIDGGLVALTKFEQPIGFEPDSLREIVMAYIN